MDPLDCTVMPYVWGSRTAIPDLVGRDASGQPEAELWMGAHPVAPSTLERDGVRVSLESAIARDPIGELGASVVDTLGPRLPFLLKVLAAAEPLSLQAHPTMAQARRGWDREEDQGIPRDAAHRSYRDASHKPELLCALTPFVALSGFRDIPGTMRLFEALGSTSSVLEPLRRAPDARGLAETFRRLTTLGPEDVAEIVTETIAACRTPGDFPAERSLALRLAELYPGDVGIVSALFLELVTLQPGEAIYLGAGNLHAYIEGTGVEIMASSDNVLRGGLTRKHVDVPELLSVLDFDGGPARAILPRRLDTHESVYDTPAREFRLSRIEVSGDVTRTTRGPEILFVTAGSVHVDGIALERGRSLFVPARAPRYTLTGKGTVFRATTTL